MEPADTLAEIVIRVVVALACGGLLGWERERHRRPAGLRTHMMVALGGAAFTMLALTMFHATLGKENASLDPLRVVQGIVGGIGFLGAGTIIQSRGSVKGVTTAATIWVVGSIGVACGAGFYEIAVTTVVAAFLILTAIGWIEGYWLDKRGRRARLAAETNPADSSEEPSQDDG